MSLKWSPEAISRLMRWWEFCRAKKILERHFTPQIVAAGGVAQ